MLRSGVGDAWNQIHPALYGVAYAAASGLDSIEDRQDVASEAVCRLIEYTARVKTLEELKLVVATISQNLAADLHRKKTAQKRGSGQISSLEAVVEQNEATEPASPALQPDQILAVAQIAGLLRQCLKSLKPQFAGMLEDRYFREMEYKELAQKYGLSIDSVGVYLKRAGEELRQKLEQNPGLLKETLEFLR